MDFNQLCKGENIEYTKEKLPKYKIQNTKYWTKKKKCTY